MTLRRPSFVTRHFLVVVASVYVSCLRVRPPLHPPSSARLSLPSFTPGWISCHFCMLCRQWDDSDQPTHSRVCHLFVCVSAFSLRYAVYFDETIFLDPHVSYQFTFGLFCPVLVPFTRYFGKGFMHCCLSRFIPFPFPV